MEKIKHERDYEYFRKKMNYYKSWSKELTNEERNNSVILLWIYQNVRLYQILMYQIKKENG